MKYDGVKAYDRAVFDFNAARANKERLYKAGKMYERIGFSLPKDLEDEIRHAEIVEEFQETVVAARRGLMQPQPRRNRSSQPQWYDWVTKQTINETEGSEEVF